MASSSSSLPSTQKNLVFTSFHGPDVRKTFISHLRKQFNSDGITMFDDQGIERSLLISPTLTEAIRVSRISIVVLSKNYASSSWCLDELVEILECREDIGQIVMTVFHGVDPSDVRKQAGEFGIAFNETCARKPKENRQKWSQALNDVGNIIGEDFLNWDNEAIMIEKIAKDVLDKLKAIPSRNFDGIVGLEAHLREIQSLLDFDYDGVKMVAITGPAGIGKTTIARALHGLHYKRFQLNCFVDNLWGSYRSGFDEYCLKLRLQELFLSEVLDRSGMRKCHLGAIKENLSDQRVLIILDDVNNLKQLEALTNQTTCFGPGSRIVVTTENKELLQQHGINNTYHVGFPSNEQALKILCRYAFRQTFPRPGFKELAESVTELCGKLPLSLRVVGSSLRGKNEGEWEEVMNMLESILDRDINDVLRVGFESLDENEQMLFLHIGVFFNNRDGDLVKSMFADSNLDVKHGLKILENRSLIEIEISTYREKIVMHKLLQQVGKKVIHKQEAWKCFLMDAPEICDAPEDVKGTRNVVGISFDISGIDGVSISKNAFKRIRNIPFLKVYKGKYDGNDRMDIVSGEMEFPHHLRLLHWEAYPSKSLPPSFHPENLIELNMQNSQLEYLWQGTQPLKSLRKMDFSGSFHLKEVPDLSNAKNLEMLKLSGCQSLEEIPSSCSHLHKLTILFANDCINLQVIPADMNLASLELVFMGGCLRLRNIPVMSTNIKQLYITNTAVEDVPPSIRLCSHLEFLDIHGSGKFKGLTHLPQSVQILNLNSTDIERIPDCIRALRGLECLRLSCCRKLASLPELPRSLRNLMAVDCESLETVFFPMNIPKASLDFTNCFKLGQQARSSIIQQPFFRGKALLPGRKTPAEFDHRAKGNFLIIRPDGNPYTGIVFCVVISSRKKTTESVSRLSWSRIMAQNDGYPEGLTYVGEVSKFRSEHLFIFHSCFLHFFPHKDSREIVYKFSSEYHDFDIIECGAKILTEVSMIVSHEFRSDQVIENDIEFESSEVAVEVNTEQNDHTNGVICDSNEDERHTDCWSWLFLFFGLSDFVRNVGSLVSGRRR